MKAFFKSRLFPLFIAFFVLLAGFFLRDYYNDSQLLWFALGITLLFVVVIYVVVRRMDSSQMAKEKLLAHLRIAQEGLAVFDNRRHLILANKLFSTYGDLISANHLSLSEKIIYQPEFYNVRMFLEKYEEVSGGGEKCFSDKIEKDGRTFSVRCVRFRDGSFEISINDITRIVAQSQPLVSTKNPQNIDKETVNLSLIVRNLLQEINKKIVEQNIRVVNELPDALLLSGNPSMLYSIFRNLFDNAISYAGDGCEICLRNYRTDSEFYYFSFSDNGVGVSPEHLNRLFERFYRVDKGRSRKLGGTGLGLAIVKNAVIFHGGTISARGNSGGGLEFVFTLKK